MADGKLLQYLAHARVLDIHYDKEAHTFTLMDGAWLQYSVQMDAETLAELAIELLHLALQREFHIQFNIPDERSH